MVRLPGGVVVRASDLQPRGGRFESRPLAPRATLGKLFTHLCLACSPSSIIWYQRKLGAKQALHATHWPRVRGIAASALCLAEGYRNGDQRPMGLCGLGNILAF